MIRSFQLISADNLWQSHTGRKSHYPGTNLGYFGWSKNLWFGFHLSPHSSSLTLAHLKNLFMDFRYNTICYNLLHTTAPHKMHGGCEVSVDICYVYKSTQPHTLEVLLTPSTICALFFLHSRKIGQDARMIGIHRDIYIQGYASVYIYIIGYRDRRWSKDPTLRVIWP